MNRIQLLLLAGFTFAISNVYGQKNDAQPTITVSDAAKMKEPVLATENQNIMSSPQMVALKSAGDEPVILTNLPDNNTRGIQVSQEVHAPSIEKMNKNMRQTIPERTNKSK